MTLLDWLIRLSGRAMEYEVPQPEVRKLPQEVAGLNFMTAINAHNQWKTRLEASLQGGGDETLDLAEAASDTACTLGQWIYGPGGAAYGNLDSFAELRREHARFHRDAGTVLSEARMGHAEAARALLQGDYQRASDRMKMLLAKLYVQLQEEDR